MNLLRKFQFLSTLLRNYHVTNVRNLLQSGIKCVQLVGSMTLNARDSAIKKFIEDPDCKIFLMSLKAGGVALNLTVASHVSLALPHRKTVFFRHLQPSTS